MSNRDTYSSSLENDNKRVKKILHTGFLFYLKIQGKESIKEW